MQLERIYRDEIQAKGFVYGDLEIIHSGVDFYVIDAFSQGVQREVGQPVLIDGTIVCSMPIAEFGFKMEDFEDVPVNELGLKEVAKAEGETLVVTANGLFVIYFYDMPSLLGLPSLISEMSGVWVNSEGVVQLPKHSIYTENESVMHFLITTETSFREIPMEVLSLLSLVTRMDEDDKREDVQRLCFCDHCTSSLNTSAYEKAEPKLKDIRIEWTGNSFF